MYLLAGACQRRMEAIKVNLAKEYQEILGKPGSRDTEVRQLLNEITIGETCLFRSQGQLDALKNVLLPQLVEERSKLGLKKLRVWSAGCSTGEEPYTLAMFLAEEREKNYPRWTFEIPGLSFPGRFAMLPPLVANRCASKWKAAKLNSIRRSLKPSRIH